MHESRSEFLLGFEIPYLPDALAGSLHLTADRPQEQLAEVLARQVNLVAGLHRWQGVGFSLRYLFQPGEGRVQMGLLVRLPSELIRNGDAVSVDKFSAQLRHYFATHEVPLNPLPDRHSLDKMAQPFVVGGIAEVRQRKQIIHLPSGDGFYTVFPFQDPGSSWIPVMRMLMAQPSAVLLSIYLQPTELSTQEERVFASTASEAQSRVQQNFEGKSMRFSLSNPQAEIVSRTYSEYLTRLHQPFLSVLQIASTDPDLCVPLAQAIGGEVSPILKSDENSVRGGFDVVACGSVAELRASRAILETLDFEGGAWLNHAAPNAKERLSFLCDARSAAACFRFPVSIRGGVPGITTRQHAPSQLGPQTARDKSVYLGRVENAQDRVFIPKEHLKRHTLIAGINGSGKTTTCFQILFELQRMGVPFLVIEPAKQEYRTMLKSHLGSELRVFTLGDGITSPFQLNPLEIQPGVRVEGHISKILACLLSSLPTFGALPSLLEASLFRVYLDCGWKSTDVGAANDTRRMPTLRDFYFAIIQAADERGYSGDTRDDMQAAAAGRIVSFLRGSKGRMLDVQRSMPMAELMSRPTVLELDSLSDEEKALVMLFLITSLREYLGSTRTGGHLQHVTLIEEAHRVMSKATSSGNREVSADTSAGSVALVSAALSEVRAYGEGIIIAEQVPGRLIEDALKNTNTKIVHRLPGADDRLAVGETMNLEGPQETYLTKLRPGRIAYFGEGQERPVFVEVHDVRQEQDLPERVTNEEVNAAMSSVMAKVPQGLQLPYTGCLYCKSQCNHRDEAALMAFEVPVVKRFQKLRRECAAISGPDRSSEAWHRLTDFALQSVGAKEGVSEDKHLAWCLMTHLYPGVLGKGAAELFFEHADNSLSANSVP
ncbi:MAG: ATP-binding protein [Verrucomicrobiaceae bacterium]|nr:ATP-binding protein [Verrucomicrobiaceae bacterium]